ncbi:hypothetical protein GCM10009745_80090 [Kribbella yunnanensis]|uniref:Uncharacterized protein n=1 Tax=Kribbella yunnanensis TaxID=190194 RepID=A0ABP4V710_9ACTN
MTRVVQLVGTINPTTHSTTHRSPDLVGAAPIRTDARGWAETLVRLATEQPFTVFVFWPEKGDEMQVRRFGEEVAPMVTASLG